MDIKEKEELVRLLLKYQDEIMQNVINWGSLTNNPFNKIANDIAQVRCYLSLEVIEQIQREGERKK